MRTCAPPPPQGEIMIHRETSQFGKNPRTNKAAFTRTDRVDRVTYVNCDEKDRLFNDVTCIIWIFGREPLHHGNSIIIITLLCVQ
jgi:hypothetical protein